MAEGGAVRQSKPGRLAASIPAASTVIAGSAIWGASMAIAAAIGLYWRDGLIIHSRLQPVSRRD
jgi:hypothetical protein